MFRFRWLVCFAILTPAISRADDQVDFIRDIRPIFEAHCFECHGPDAAEGGLRLSQKATVFVPADSSHTPVTAGRLAESRLISVLNGSDAAGLKMPPEDSGEPLAPEQVALITRWVEQGANWPAEGDVLGDRQKHWAWKVPMRPQVPNRLPPSALGLESPIDQFIVEKLIADNLTLAPEADRHTLLRRVSLDLTGLPPTPQMVDEFIGDTRPDAYERLVDRLLADPAYGERWARMWLDVARYADSKGYGSDPLRVIWRYRDWVIDAFNRNLPYDQFTIEQLAGDLLPNATPQQVLATAFHRNTMANDEGGTDDEEFRVAAVKDRAETTAQVWMGLTMGCAKCHTHKFDPITQREYYQFYAVFNQTEDADSGDEAPRVDAISSLEQSQATELESQLAAAQVAVEQAMSQAPTEQVTSARYVRVDLPGVYKYLSLAEVQVYSQGQNVAIGKQATQSSVDYAGEPQRAIDGVTEGDYYKANSVSHTKADINPWWEVDLGGAVSIERLAIWNRTDGGVHTRLAGAVVSLLDEARQVQWQTVLAAPPQPSLELPIGAQSQAAREVVRLTAAIAEVKHSGVTTPILRDLPVDKHRTTHVMIKGNFLAPGEVVQPTIPAAFGSLPEGTEVNRLTVAHWLVSESNPLVARVAVNRFWGQLFGRGLVETEEDFGTQGSAPTHPELLDWLAIEFRDSLKWDVKQLLKTIVLSRTYRQASFASPALLEKDPYNKLHACGPRHRLEAEMVRDQALAISGLLSRKLGGPSVFPPQPDGLWKAAFNGERTWATSTGEDRYRRGLYTFWRRTVPYPSMATFDAPSRENCTLRRVPTNTPLQAFVTLNDPVFVECAQALARRILREGPGGTRERAAFGLRLCLARPAQPQQIDAIEKLINDELTHYRADAKAATEIATQPLGPLQNGIDPAEAAAWTIAANVLLNLDGVLTVR